MSLKHSELVAQVLQRMGQRAEGEPIVIVVPGSRLEPTKVRDKRVKKSRRRKLSLCR